MSTTLDTGETVCFREALLWAGDLVASREPMRLSTVLGSCVSVCLYDVDQRVGGMNHYLVPRGAAAIHGDWSTEELIDQVLAQGGTRPGLRAKLFGGGSPLRLENDNGAIGPENVRVAREVLAAHRIPVLAERIGHTGGLRLFFENWTGVVWLRTHAGTS